MRTIIEHPCGGASYFAVMELLTARGYTPIKSMGVYTLECEPFRVETETDMLLTRELMQQVQAFGGVFRGVTLPWAESPAGVVELTGDALAARGSTYFELVAHSPRLQSLVDTAYPGRRVKQIARGQLDQAVHRASTAYKEDIARALRAYLRTALANGRFDASPDAVKDYIDDVLTTCMDAADTQLDAILRKQILPAIDKSCANTEVSDAII
jgi:hypothetical protein